MTIILQAPAPSERAFTLTAQDVIDRVRNITNDNADAVEDLRVDDTEMLRWLNDCLATMTTLAPMVFAKSGTHVCAAGHRQVLQMQNAVALVDVVGVPMCAVADLTAFAPGWQSAATGAMRNWMRVDGEPLSFLCYPPSAEGQALPIVYVDLPAALVEPADVLPVPEFYMPAIVEYVVAMVEYKDDEHVNTNRQQAALQSFAARLKG